MNKRSVYRRRRLAAGGGLVALLLVIAVATGAFSGGGKPAAEADPQAARSAPAPPELPRGGRSVLPDKRVVAFYGAPQSPRAGRARHRDAGQRRARGSSARRARTSASAARCCPRSS